MNTILKVDNLVKTFRVRKSAKLFGKRLIVNAVDSISFDVLKGETFGIVGESGCGKTTLGRLIMRLEKPSSGRIYLNGRDMVSFRGNDMMKLRGKMQMVFQDPFGTLNPVKTIGYTISEPLKIHKICGDKIALQKRVKEILDAVGLPSTRDFLDKRPGELSGGERQRVGIARALVLDPDFVVADEPVSMLDASVRAEIVSLMTKLKGEFDLTYLFITHEMAVAYNICDRIAVMYAGKIVELGNAEQIIRKPQHPYTRLLMDAIPPLRPNKQWGQHVIEGEVAYYVETPKGCKFINRCPYAQDICLTESPELVATKGPGHYVACYNYKVAE